MEYLLPFLVLGGFLAAIGFSLYWRCSRSESLMDTWARENGYNIVASENRNVFRGPFFMRSTEGQTVFRVTLKDRAGNLRSGWLRCGGWWAGLFSDKVTIKWDAEDT